MQTKSIHVLTSELMQLVKRLKECTDLSDALTDYVAGTQLIDSISEAFEDIAMSAVASTDNYPYLTTSDIRDMANAKLDIIYGGRKNE